MTHSLGDAWAAIVAQLPTPRSPRLAENVHQVGQSIASIGTLLPALRAELVRLAPSGGNVDTQLLAQLDKLAPPARPHPGSGPHPAPPAQPPAAAQAPAGPQAPAAAIGARPQSPHVAPNRRQLKGPLDLFPHQGGALEGGKARALKEWVSQATDALTQARAMIDSGTPFTKDQARLLTGRLNILLSHQDGDEPPQSDSETPGGTPGEKEKPPANGADRGQK